MQIWRRFTCGYVSCAQLWPTGTQPGRWRPSRAQAGRPARSTNQRALHARGGEFALVARLLDLRKRSRRRGLDPRSTRSWLVLVLIVDATMLPVGTDHAMPFWLD